MIVVRDIWIVNRSVTIELTFGNSAAFVHGTMHFIDHVSSRIFVYIYDASFTIYICKLSVPEFLYSMEIIRKKISLIFILRHLVIPPSSISVYSAYKRFK